MIYTDIFQIFKDGRRLINDFTNCDLSNIDLSNIKECQWNGAIFYNTNFENTNIKFNPKKVYCYGDCNFTNCDLSYMSIDDLKRILLYNDFKNINLKISSYTLLKIIRTHLNSVLLDKIPQKMKILNRIESILELDKDGILKRFYNDIKPYFNNIDSKILFFKNGKIKSINFKTLDLSYLDSMWLVKFCFDECYFEDLTLSSSPSDIEEAFKIKGSLHYEDTFMVDCYISKLHMPISWNNQRRKQLLVSPIYYQTSLFLILKGIIDECEYSYENIVKNIKSMLPNTNNVFIEDIDSILSYEDLLHLIKDVMGKRYAQLDNRNEFYEPNLTSWNIIASGNLSVDEYYNLSRFYNLYINRDTINDKNSKVLSSKDLERLEKLCLVNNTLCCTCHNNGINSKDEIIEYIRFAADIGYKKILFKKTYYYQEFNSNYDSFKDTLEHLKKLGFSISRAIYSTLNYELIIAKFKHLTVYFKKYENNAKISEDFLSSSNRLFDFIMQADGTIESIYDYGKSLQYRK